MSTQLEVRNLTKFFKTAKGWLHAVDDVSFEMGEGETLGIVGESGCGKSTLGRTILHLVEPTSGTILFQGKDITQMTSAQFKESRRQMQIIFQDPFSSLNPRMTVEDIIREPLDIFHLYTSKKERDEKVQHLMETVGLSSRLSRVYPHELDGGRRQRIGIARALAVDPKFIVCDEPVSALDVSIQAQILNLMQDLQEQRGVSYLFITHDLSVVKHISDNICVMYLGKVVEKCGTKELFSNTKHPYTKALLEAIPIPIPHAKEGKEILHGEITSPIDPPPGCRFAPRCRKCTERCRKENPAFKEVSEGHFVACHLYD